MKKMKWESLLCDSRLLEDNQADKVNQETPVSRTNFVQDYDRVVFSAPFRRLANKTQVQPLYEHDHVHHRLIHSIEVSSVGRSLAMKIGQWLEKEGEIQAGEAVDLASIVQAACVAHDIGNPPFGHSGEEAIGDWFSEQFVNPKGLMAELDANRQMQFSKFEGNAQGFRIITRLEMRRNSGGMRLCKATLGAFTKYPVTADVSEKAGVDYVGLKKFGVFHAELGLFRDVARSLGLPKEESEHGTWWRRHPLVFVVEAADDICYNIVDLEDAFTTGELDYETVADVLKQAAKTNRGREELSQAEHISLLRAMAINKAVQSCFEAFKAHYDDIMCGTFNMGLIDAAVMAADFTDMKKISRGRVFTARRKTELEISGRRVLNNVLSGLLPVYEELGIKNWDEAALSAHNQQLVRALSLDLGEISNPEGALHSLADFTSGMTDRYAVRISRMLSGI